MRKHVLVGPLTKGRCPWDYCRHCGLVGLKNDASRKELRKPCPGEPPDAEGYVTEIPKDGRGL